MASKQLTIIQQIQDQFGAMSVWTRIAIYNERSADFERMAAEEGFVNAHVVAYWEERESFALKTRWDHIESARKMGLTNV